MPTEYDIFYRVFTVTMDCMFGLLGFLTAILAILSIPAAIVWASIWVYKNTHHVFPFIKYLMEMRNPKPTYIKRDDKDETL